MPDKRYPKKLPPIENPRVPVIEKSPTDPDYELPEKKDDLAYLSHHNAASVLKPKKTSEAALHSSKKSIQKMAERPFAINPKFPELSSVVQQETGYTCLVLDPNAYRESGERVLVQGADETLYVYTSQGKPINIKLQSSKNPFFRGSIPIDYAESRKEKAGIEAFKTQEGYQNEIQKLSGEPSCFKAIDVKISGKEILDFIQTGKVHLESIDEGTGDFTMRYVNDDGSFSEQLYRINLKQKSKGSYILDSEIAIDTEALPKEVSKGIVKRFTGPQTPFFVVEVYNKDSNAWQKLEQLGTQEGLSIKSDNDAVFQMSPKKDLELSQEMKRDLEERGLPAEDSIMYRRFDMNNNDERDLMFNYLHVVDRELYEQFFGHFSGSSAPSNAFRMLIDPHLAGNVSILELRYLVKINKEAKSHYPFMKNPQQHAPNVGYNKGCIPFSRAILPTKDGAYVAENEQDVVVLLMSLKDEKGERSATSHHFDVHPAWDLNIWAPVIKAKVEANLPIYLETVQTYADQNIADMSGKEQKALADYVLAHFIRNPREEIDLLADKPFELGAYIHADGSDPRSYYFKIGENWDMKHWACVYDAQKKLAEGGKYDLDKVYSPKEQRVLDAKLEVYQDRKSAPVHQGYPGRRVCLARDNPLMNKLGVEGGVKPKPPDTPPPRERSPRAGKNLS